MIKVAIVEDNLSEAELIKTHIERYAEEEGIDIGTRHFKNGMQFLDAYKQDFDVILMDVEMPAMNGMETAKRLRKLNKDVPLIFITNMAQYAIRGYEVDAMGFFIKPIRYTDFYNRFTKAISLSMTHQVSVTVKTESGLMALNVADIQYLEVENVYVSYHLRNFEGGSVKSRITLTAAEAQLKELGPFYRCNNCYLVNLEHVTKLCANSVIVAGSELLISRHRKKDFVNALTAYLGSKK